MLLPTSRPRRGQLLLWASICLFAAFAGLAFIIKQATRPRFEADPKLLEEMATAEFVEEPALAADLGWPQWRGVRRDGVASAHGLLTEWPAAGPPRLWKSDLERWEGHSTFAVRGDRTYTMGRKNDEEAILCLETDTGKSVWEKSYDPRFDSASGKSFDPTAFRDSLPAPYGNGPRATPALDGDRVYTVGVTGRLQCRAVTDGALVWEHQLLKEYDAPNLMWGITCSPLVDGDLVFVDVGGPGGKSLVAFDKISGKEAWKSQDDPGSYSAPVAITVDGERQIVFFTSHSLVGVAAKDGALRWRFPWETKPAINVATPIPFRTKSGGKERQYVFISSGYGKGCALLALVTNNKGGQDVRPMFESSEFCSHYSTPVRVGDHVYGFNESTLVCMSLRDGKIRWKKSGYHKGNLLAAGEYLLILGEQGKLALLKASPEESEPVASVNRAMERKCWAMPVLADGRLLLRDEEKIRCYDLRKK